VRAKGALTRAGLSSSSDDVGGALDGLSLVTFGLLNPEPTAKVGFNAFTGVFNTLLGSKKHASPLL